MSYVIELLKLRRKELGLKQSELGEKLGLPQSHISKIEREETDPRLATITDMARVMDQELMLVPRQQVPHIRAILRGDDLDKPMWQPDEEFEED
jgi:predicted transcriptional regulator